MIKTKGKFKNRENLQKKTKKLISLRVELKNFHNDRGG